MAKSLTQQYGSAASTPDSYYPGGTFKNAVSPNPGTPLEQTWARNMDGFFQRLIKRFTGRWDGTDENAINSQYDRSCIFSFGNSTKPPEYTMQNVCSGLSSSYGIPYENPSSNFLSIGATVNDACIGIDYATQNPMIYAIQDNADVFPITGPLSYSGSPSAGSALSLGTSAELKSICSDGENLYVLWRNAGAYGVSRYAMQVPAAPYFLGSSFLGWDHANADFSKMIVASETQLAVSSDNISGNMGVSIVPIAGGTVLSGNGNCSSSSYIVPNGRLISDGTHVYWLGREYSGGVYSVTLYSAKISDPTTSDYSSTLIVSAALGRDVPSAIFNVGGSSGTIACVSGSGRVYLFSKLLGEARPAFDIANLSATSEDHYNCISGSDGINIWVATRKTYTLVSGESVAFIKIPIDMCGHGSCLGVYDSLEDYTATIIPTSITLAAPSNYESGRMLFDGVDMWYVSRSGFLNRITAPGMR